MNIAFRVDAASNIGIGHLMRCLALSEELIQRDHVCYFLTKINNDELINIMKINHHRDTKFTEETRNFCNKLSSEIIGAALEVHKTLGPGLLESVYEECLCYELKLKDLNIKRQFPLQVRYKDITLDFGYRVDIIVEDMVIVELKTVGNIEPIHKAQLLT